MGKVEPSKSCQICGQPSWVIIVSSDGFDICDVCSDLNSPEMNCSGINCDACFGLEECNHYQLIQPLKA